MFRDPGVTALTSNVSVRPRTGYRNEYVASEMPM
jgi:hypothetical protein